MLRVLLITREPWRDDSNEGSVLTGWFRDQAMELANLCCKPGLPSNPCCERYFQMTDRMALQNLLRHTPMGATVKQEGTEASAIPSAEAENRGFYNFFRKNNWASFHLLRDCLWSMAHWRSEALNRFIDDFAPDVIFAPLCYSRYVMAIQRYAATRTHAPMVGVIWDDLYSLKQWRISPVYWLNRFLQRASVRKSVAQCRWCYTLCQQQASVFAKQLGCEMRVLPKAASPMGECHPQPASSDDALRVIYAGGIYYGRLRTLQRIVAALRRLNAEGHPCQLAIFSSSPGIESLAEAGVCELHEAIPMEKLREEYAASQIALHVEGFDRKDAWLTRDSFSSKIVDCMASGCAVLTVCPEINLGWRYLRDGGAALCVSDPGQIYTALNRLISEPATREALARRARECVQSDHDQQEIAQALHDALAGIEQVQ